MYFCPSILFSPIHVLATYVYILDKHYLHIFAFHDNPTLFTVLDDVVMKIIG